MRPPTYYFALMIVLALALPAVHAQERGQGQRPTPAAFGPNGSYYALIIGIDDYAAPLPKLLTPVNDARAIDQLLREKYGFQVQLLVNADATRKAILNAINKYRNTLAANDNLLIYYAGHGLLDAGVAYWLPSGADPGDSSGWVSAEDVTHGIRALTAGHVLVISDSCYSGGLAQAGQRFVAPAQPTAEQNVYLEKMLHQRSRTLMASGGNEPVADAGTNGHSVFAYPLLEGLEHPDKVSFTAQHLFEESVRVRVGGNTRQTPLYTPIADSGHDGGDFVFVRTALTPAELAASARAAPPSAAELEAQDKYKRGELMAGMQRYGEAVSLLTASCDSAYFEACAYLGLMYANATGVPKSPAKASGLYRKACEGGAAIGCTRLGALFDGGIGVQKDEAAAAGFYRKGCDGNDPSGCSNLGSMYASGDGVAKDPAQAAALLHKACDIGDAQGCFNLALTLAHGVVVPKDEAQAAVLYRKACESGLAQGCLNLGVMTLDGEGVAKGDAQAGVLFRKACDLGNASGCSDLANLYSDGRGIAKDDVQATEFYRKACDLGDAKGCTNLGIAYEYATGVPEDKAHALSLYEKACAANNALGCRNLGINYGKGIGTPPDGAKAVEAFRKGCELKDQESCEVMKRLKP